MNKKYELIAILADGRFHSGEILGEKLNLSRSAIWKLISQLSEMGIPINRIKGKGYQAPDGLSLLDFNKINNGLTDNAKAKLNLEVLQEINSTNQYLLNHAKKISGTVVLAEHQTAGRGRRQRTWQSPYGANIYCSFLWRFDLDPSELKGLSLATGVAVANALERYGIPQVQLKWPNDVLWQGKKIAGILLEITGETHSSTTVVLGIGLNVKMSNLAENWIDLASIIGKIPNRNLMAIYLIEEVLEMLTLFQQTGFDAFHKHWSVLDAYYQREVILTTPTQNFTGIAQGIDATGELILLDHNQQQLKFAHGEVSLRPI